MSEPTKADAELAIELLQLVGKHKFLSNTSDENRQEFAEAIAAHRERQQRELEREQQSHEITIRQRDAAEDAADVLAHGIARIYDPSKSAMELIGEHSNLNCPWERAGELLEEIGERQPQPPPPGD